jgi:hypothetical protein
MAVQMAHFRLASTAALRANAAALLSAILVQVFGDNTRGFIGLMGVILTGDSGTFDVSLQDGDSRTSESDDTTDTNTAVDWSSWAADARGYLALRANFCKYLALPRRYFLTNLLCL